MILDQKLQKKQYSQIWQEFCGFLDFSIEDCMAMQNRLMQEQIELYCQCELGRKIMRGKKPRTVDEFRQVVPLTRYEDYAPILLSRIESALPAKPLLWIETTWEGAINPIKLAPYTESMVRCHKNNFITSMILATSDKRGQFSLTGGENFLYGMAPLPYITGLAPLVLKDELTVNWLPPEKEAVTLDFSQRNKLGFKMGMQRGVDLFFGLSSVIAKVGDQFTSSGGSGREFNPFKSTPAMNYRLLKAWIRSKVDQTPILPKDIWTLKGLICAGTDSASVKKKIEHDWGIKPLEVFGGTETTCIATETWSKNGLVLFPDVCFYEFIPKEEMEKNLADPDYVPRTYLLNELEAGKDYELVISNLKGGAFARYRVGDMLKCLSVKNETDGIMMPQFAYLDRVPNVIDIAGFTRISEATIKQAIEVSKLDISNWFAVKEFDENLRAFLHLYVEMTDNRQAAVNKEILTEHLAIYFRYIDHDYKDLKSLLGIEPLVVSIIPMGTMSKFAERYGRNPRKINPAYIDVIELLKIARSGNGAGN